MIQHISLYTSATMDKAHTTLLILFYILLTITPSLAQSACNDGASLCWKCSDKNDSDSSPSATYKDNLKALLLSFLTAAQNDVGYYNISKGTTPDDTVTVIGLCRGDIVNDTNNKLCQSCLSEAATSVLANCPTQKEAIIWAEQCMIRYSNDSSFHLMKEEPLLVLTSPTNYTDVGAETFNPKLKTLLDNLTMAASSSGGKYASSSVNVTASRTIYSLVQCIPSLSQEECSDCLDESSSMIPDRCCGGVEGARVLKPDCTLRYENAIFYTPTRLSSTTNNNQTSGGGPSTSTGEEKNGKDKIVIPALSSLIGVVVLGILVHGFP